MKSPENFGSINDRLKQPIAYLDPENPEHKEIIDSIKESGEECRREFPTVELAVDAYRKGIIMEAYLESGYPREEIDRVFESLKENN